MFDLIYCGSGSATADRSKFGMEFNLRAQTSAKPRVMNRNTTGFGKVEATPRAKEPKR
jgi:hypothetical protein